MADSQERVARNPGGRPRKNAGFAQVSGPSQSKHVHDVNVHVDMHSGHISSQDVPATRLKRLRPEDLGGEYNDFAFIDEDEGGSTQNVPIPADAPRGDPETTDGNADEYNDSPEEDTSGKRKRYQSSDDPMEAWKPWLSQFLEETLRRHGLGNSTLFAACSSCKAQLRSTNMWKGDHPEESPVHAISEDVCEELFRCKSCGDFLECGACCRKRHNRSPVHVIEVWRNATWERTSLADLGLVFQLGHQGAACRHPEDKIRTMTVLHVNGIHTVHYRYCDCAVSDNEFKWQQLLRTAWYPATTFLPSTCATLEVLELYRRLKTIATVNVRDFFSVLEDATNPYGTEWTPDRYKAFSRMQRQWAFLTRVRRSGVAHEEGGLDDAKDSRVAIECWACPRVGVNLPTGWDTVDNIYTVVFLSTDANFRMSCKMRESPRVDLPLYDGLGVQPSMEVYHDWLRSYITEQEMSTCISFAALMHKDTKFAVGLRWSGVIGVICARHEILLGLGDLEKGERFKNTDFILYWLLARMGLKEVTITYDIACQYKKHFLERIKALPDCLKQLDLPDLTWGLPVWHGNVHAIECETAESLKYKVGVGKTDGEGIERVWSVFNPTSYMTKEEHPGARHDDIEDKADKHNFGKNINMGKTLLRRLHIALEERKIQVDSFSEVNRTLAPELEAEWRRMVEDWLGDPSKPNPYAPSGGVTTSEAKERLKLQQEEEADEKKEREEERARKEAGREEVRQARREEQGKAPPPPLSAKEAKKAHVTMAGFLILGLKIEDGIERIKRMKQPNPSPEYQSKLLGRRRGLDAKVTQFRRWQLVYMPLVSPILVREEVARREKGSAAPMSEDVRLFLPSMCAGRDDITCSKRLVTQEASLRRGQCADALSKLRSRLLARRYLENFRNQHSRGQRETGRASTLIQSIARKVAEAASKYRRCRGCLLNLVGATRMDGFRELLEGDVKVYTTAESDEDAVKHLGRLDKRGGRITGTGRKAKQPPVRRDVPGETRATMSWIWTAGGGPGEADDAYLHECVQIEWAKSLARKTRWEEEVEIIKEEMRRTLRSLRWEEKEWLERSQRREKGLRVEELSGRRSYALKQARDRARIRETFEELWKTKDPSRGQKAGPMDSLAQSAAAALIREEHAERRT